jgi:hypothetical protein
MRTPPRPLRQELSKRHPHGSITVCQALGSVDHNELEYGDRLGESPRSVSSQWPSETRYGPPNQGPDQRRGDRRAVSQPTPSRLDADTGSVGRVERGRRTWEVVPGGPFGRRRRCSRCSPARPDSRPACTRVGVRSHWPARSRPFTRHKADRRGLGTCSFLLSGFMPMRNHVLLY